MNLLSIVPAPWRWGALALLLIAVGGLCWTKGARHVQDDWDADNAQRAQQVVTQQQGVIRDLKDQKQRVARAEAQNAKLTTDYNALSGRLADSVRAYASRPACAVHPAVADTGGQSSGSAPGSGDSEAAELAGLAQAASQSCLDAYRELKGVWVAEPPSE